MPIAVLMPAMALAYLTLALVTFGQRKPGYSHVVHTISELGEVGAPDARAVAWLVFFPVGLLQLLVAGLHFASTPLVALVAVCLGAGYVVAAVFPCDPGSPVSGSVRQGIHNLGGGVEYVCGGLGFLKAAGQFGAAFEVLGYAILVVAVALTVFPQTSVRGLVQRVGELGLFGGLSALVWISAGSSF
ncbi:MAG: DUF998 domain-containing protein [Pseudomonadota bacterium]